MCVTEVVGSGLSGPLLIDHVSSARLSDLAMDSGSSSDCDSSWVGSGDRSVDNVATKCMPKNAVTTLGSTYCNTLGGWCSGK